MSARVRTDARISRRRRAVARARRRLLAWCGALAGAGGLAWTAFFSPLLHVRALELVGAEHTSAAQAWEASGLSRSDNLLRIDTGAVERAVESLPWVAGAEVDRILPGTVRVRVRERRPAAILRAGGTAVTLAAGGAVLAYGSAAPGLPVIEAPPEELAPGEAARSPAARAALAVLAALPGRLRDRVVAVTAPSPEDIVLRLDDGLEVRYGAAGDSAAKNEVLGALLARLARSGERPAYVDVSVPARPALGPPARP